MSAFEKVTRFDLLKLFCVKVVIISSIKVMNSGHTLIIEHELLLRLLDSLGLWGVCMRLIAWLLIVNLPRAHLLHRLVQALQFLWTQIRLKVFRVKIFTSFIYDILLRFIMLARWNQRTLWAPLVIYKITLQIDG